MAATRIYKVSSKVHTEPLAAHRLIRATSQAQALALVASDFTVSVATQEELLELRDKGVNVETANAAATEPPPPKT